MLAKNPRQILKKAILGMLRRNALRHQSIEKRLRIYIGPEHPHTTQLPPSTPCLPLTPKIKNGDFHYGLVSYTSQHGFYEPEKAAKAQAAAEEKWQYDAEEMDFE